MRVCSRTQRDEMKLQKAKKVKLSDFENESWLQAQIEQDPTILGLGDVVVLRRERRQSSGGRIDFLLHDPETDTMYEVEIMLGATDESHIIRTIEYWDIERKRYPQYDPLCRNRRRGHHKSILKRHRIV